MEKYTPLAAQVRARRERFLYLEIVNFLFLGEQRSCDGRGGAQRPVWRVNEPKKTGARTRGQNPLVHDTDICLVELVKSSGEQKVEVLALFLR